MTDESIANPLKEQGSEKLQKNSLSASHTGAPSPLLLLPEHAGTKLSSLQYLSGVAALVLMFFASAGLTVAYLSTVQSASVASQTAGTAATGDSFDAVSLIGQAAYLLDLTTNRVLYSKNPDVQLPLASLSKVPLVLAVSEVVPPETLITIPPHQTPDGAPVRLPAGLRFSAQDLIDFTLVASSNEGAGILASVSEDRIRKKYPQATADSSTLWRMNDIAKNLGLEHMLFLNTNGLDLSDTQASAYGSAHDVAVLFAYANETAGNVFGHTSRTSVKIRAASGETVTGVNTDSALPAIPGLLMGKTGYTELAGGNLSIVFDVGLAHPVVAVVLHSSQDGRFEDIKKLVSVARRAITRGSE